MDIKKSLCLVDVDFRKNLSYISFKDEFRSDTPDQYSLGEFYADETAIITEDASIEDFIIEGSLSEGTTANESVLSSLRYTSPEYAYVINLVKNVVILYAALFLISFTFYFL